MVKNTASVLGYRPSWTSGDRVICHIMVKWSVCNVVGIYFSWTVERLIIWQEWFQKFQLKIWSFLPPWKLGPTGIHCHRNEFKLTTLAVLHEGQKCQLFMANFKFNMGWDRYISGGQSVRLLFSLHRVCIRCLCHFWMRWLPVTVVLHTIEDAIMHLAKSYFPFQRKRPSFFCIFGCLKWKEDETTEQCRSLYEMFCGPWHFQWMDSHRGQQFWIW